MNQPIDSRPTHDMTGAQTGHAQAQMSRVMGQMQFAAMNPRDEDRCMDRIMRECETLSLAEVAEYSYKRGDSTVRDASIRLAEVIARNWGNIESGIIELSRWKDASTGKQWSELEAFAIDLQTNYRDFKVFRCELIRETQHGNYALTSDRDIYELTANLGARRKRACILGVVPVWVKEQALTKCRATVEANLTVDESTLNSMVERFARFKVTREMLEAFMRHPLTVDQTTVREISNMRSIWTSINDRVQRASDYFDFGTQQQNSDAPATERTKDDDLFDAEGSSISDEPAAPTPDEVNAKVDAAQSMDDINECAALEDVFKSPAGKAAFRNRLKAKRDKITKSAGK